MPSTAPEILSWCPFAGRSNDPKYAQCYNANEEHTPRIFTVQGLCKHVLNIHADMYPEFAPHVEHYIELNRCTADGVRIVPGTATPLNTTHIQRELEEFKGEIRTDEEAQPAVDQNADEDSWHDNVLIDHIHLSLAAAPAWAGTLQDLHSKLSDRMENTLGHHNFKFLDTLHSLCEGLTRIKPSLEQDHIRCFIRTSYVDFDKRIIVLQTEVGGKFAPVYEETIEALLLQTQKDVVFRRERREERRTMHEAIRLADRIQKLVSTTPIWAGTMQDLRSKITARRDLIPPPKNMGKWLTRNKLMLNHLDIRFFIPAYNDYNASVVVLQRKEEGTFRSINELHEVIKAQIAGTFDFDAPPAPIQRKEEEIRPVEIEPDDVESTPECKNPLKTTEHRIRLVIERIQQLLEDTSILAGSPTDIHHKVRYEVQGELFPKTAGSTGWMLNHCKERLSQKGIRLSRVYPRDSKSRNGQLVILQKSVDGKFKSNDDLYNEFLFPASTHTTTGDTVRTGVETLPKTVRDRMENDFKEGVPLKDIVRMIKSRTNMRGVTVYRVRKYLLWRNSPRPPIIRTDIDELPKTVRDVIENDFKDGVPEEAIPHRVNYITEGEFRITDTTITNYMERRNIAKPKDVRTVVWNPNAATYTDWGVLIVNNIRQLLQDTGTWTGTATQLHLIVRCEVNGEFIPRTPTILHSILKRVAQRLLGEGIRYDRSSRPPPAQIRLKRLTDAESKQSEEREEPIEIDIPTPAVELDMHIDTLEANVLVNRIHEILKDMPTWAGTLQDLHSKITALIGNRGKFGITYTPHSLGESMIKIKPDLDQDHIRCFRAPYDDFNTLIIILQREVDGEFEPVSKKSVEKILNRTERKDMCPVDPTPEEAGTVTEPDETDPIAAHEDKLLVNRIQGVLGNTPVWSGTMQDLHSKLSETLSSALLLPPIECAFMLTARELCRRITQIGPRLESADIRVVIIPHKHDFNTSPVLIQRKEDGVFRAESRLGFISELWGEPDNEETARDVVRTDPHALPNPLRTSLEADFKKGVPITEIQHKIHSQTNGKFRISKYRIEKYMKHHNITHPQKRLTSVWDSDKAGYVDWGDLIIERIQQLLEDQPTSSWTGTPTNLHPQIYCNVRHEKFPKTPHTIHKTLTGIKKRLASHNIQYIRHSSKTKYRNMVSLARPPTNIKPMKDDVDTVIARIQQLLEDTPTWIGTPTELYSNIIYETDGETPPASVSRLGRILNNNHQRLLRTDICFTRRFGPDGNTQRITLQRKVNGKFRSDDEIYRDPTHPDPDQVIATTCETPIDTTPPEPPLETADELPEIIDTPPTEHTIEVIGLSAIKQSMTEIPEDVLSRIGVKEGGRIIYLDDGENIIIKPAKYTT